MIRILARHTVRNFAYKLKSPSPESRSQFEIVSQRSWIKLRRFKMQSVQAAVLVALACLLVSCSAAKSPESNTSPVNNNPYVFPKTSNRQTICLYDGCVQGKSEEGNVRGYDAWYGIPFATPPLGPLRFRVINYILASCDLAPYFLLIS